MLPQRPRGAGHAQGDAGIYLVDCRFTLKVSTFCFLSKSKGGKERSLTDTVVNVLEKHTDFRLEYFSELNDDGEAPKITIFFNSVLHVVSGVGAGGSECWEVRG